MRSTPRWQSVSLAIARTAIGVTLVALLLRSREIRDALASLLSAFWLLALLNVAPLAGAALEARRLSVLFGARGLALPGRAAYRVVAVGTLFSLWIPGGTGGDVVKLYYLGAMHPRRKLEVAALLLVDRAVALVSLLALLLALLLAQPGLLAVPLVEAATLGVAALLGLLVVGALVVGSRRLRHSAAVAWLRARIPFGAELANATSAVHALRERKAALAAAVALSVAGHLLLVAMLALAAGVLLPEPSRLAAATLALLAMIANVLPVSPGGLGVGEAASEALFRAVGAAGGAALVAAWRLGTVLLCAVGAVLYVAGGRRPAE